MQQWDEVQKLANEFQRLQATASANRLSERNCIELVSRLVDGGQIDVLYTLDGREYVTQQHLEKEIRNELLVHRGRIGVVDLQKYLNVDLCHIEAKVADILKHDHSVALLQGELIGRDYMTALFEEVNDTLQEVGQMVVADLSKDFSLPHDFLMQHLETALGKTIKGLLDKSGSGIIYTDSYVSRYRSRIRGLFSAVTRPTPVGPIITQGHFQEKLFQSVLQELISSGQLAGSLRGRLDKAIYIPNVYTEMQNAWTDSFLASSGYLEYDALSRMGIDDPKGFVERRYGVSRGGKVTLLMTCALGEAVVTEVEAVVEEAQSSGSWIDIMSSLPSPCTTDDADMLLQNKYCDSTELRLFNSIVITKAFLQTCLDQFEPLISEKAVKSAQTHSKLLSSMSVAGDDSASRAQKGSQRKGGGKKQGRVKGRDKQDDLGESELRRELQFMREKEVSAVILEKFPDCGEEVADYIARELKGVLQSRFLEAAKAALAELGQDASVSKQRKKHGNLQEKIQGLWNTARLFEKALAHFQDSSEVTQLSKYLLKTLCSDLANMVVLSLAEDSGLTIPTEQNLSSTDRAQLISNLPVQMRKWLTLVNDSLAGKDTQGFFDAFESLCGQEFCGIMLKKLDRKKERQQLYSHQQSLLANLKEEDDPAMALHLTAVLLFQQQTGCIIHVPGKLVPLVIKFLEPHVDPDRYSVVTRVQQLVAVKWKALASSKSPSLDKFPSQGNTHTEAAADGTHITEPLESTESSVVLTDQEVKTLIDELKGLVIKPRKTAAENN